MSPKVIYIFTLSPNRFLCAAFYAPYVNLRLRPPSATSLLLTAELSVHVMFAGSLISSVRVTFLAGHLGIRHIPLFLCAYEKWLYNPKAFLQSHDADYGVWE